MLIRSRSARVAGLALAATTPFTLAAATPAFGVGDNAVVDATVTTGNVHVVSTKGLSRTTVVLCDGSVVVIPSWAGETLSGDVPVGGPVRAVFIHSGNNTTADAEALLTLLAGADAVNGNSTGAIAFPTEGDAAPCVPVSTPDPTPETPNPTPETPNPTPETPNPTPETPNPTPNTNTTPDPAPTTSVAPVTLERAQTPAEIPTLVLGETLVAGGELPRTGAGDVQPLMLVALSLVSTGLALRVGSRRIRSASSPG